MRLADWRWSAAIIVCALAGAISAPAAPPGQPYAGLWHFNPSKSNYILNLDLAADPDAPYNRATVPLASRFANPALNVNSHARPGEASVVSLSGFHAAANNPSQGSRDLEYYAFGYWQYIDRLVFWGGSAGEGQILAPNPTVIDAAHRNGVRVLGNIFFPQGTTIGWPQSFVAKVGDAYPIPDKLIEIAEHFGFDGWFINQETPGGDATLAAGFRDAIAYIRANSNLEIQWYDAMTETGAVGWQNELNSNNDWFFHYNGQPISETIFLNYWWNTTRLSNSRVNALAFGRSPYQLYAGVAVGADGYNTAVNWDALFPEDQPHRVSLGFYQPTWTYRKSADVPDFYARESRFWTGANGDPSDTTTTDAWKGVAHYIPAVSPIDHLPFVTNFNTGHGNRYYVNGQLVRPAGGGGWNWNNLGLQDVLPTWRWIVSSGSVNKLATDINLGQAWYGSMALRMTGVLDATNDIKLFATKLPVTASTTLRIAYRLGQKNAPTHMQVALAFEDAPAAFEYLAVGNALTNTWEQKAFDLSAYAGRTLAVIGLRFAAPAVVNSYSIAVGQLAVDDGQIDIPAPPSNLALDRIGRVDLDTRALGLRWTRAPGAIRYYNVYRRNADDTLTWLWAAPGDACFAPELNRTGAEAETTIEVQSVSEEFGHSAANAIARVFWEGSHWRFETDYNDCVSTNDLTALAGRPAPAFVADVAAAPVPQTHYTNARGARFVQGNNSALENAMPFGLAADGTTQSFTLEAWVRPAVINTRNTILALRPGNVQDGRTNYQFYLDGQGRVGVMFGNGSSGATAKDVVSDLAVTTGGWTHISAAYDAAANAFRFTAAGQIQTVANTAAYRPKPAPAARVTLGAKPNSSGGWTNYWVGDLDEVRFTPRLLARDELLDVDPFAAPPGSTAARWNVY